MGFYKNTIYPVLVDRLGNPGPIQALRRQLVPLASGTVLEIGVGSGSNFPYYDPSKVKKLYAVEPNAGMRHLAEEQQRRTPIEIEFLDVPGERLPLPDASVDMAVSTFTLCTIAAVRVALSGLFRVLKADGRLLFLENTLAADIGVRKWQRRWEPVHHRVFQGLYLTRDVPSLIVDAGFRLERFEATYVSRFLKAWSHCCWGSAIRV